MSDTVPNKEIKTGFDYSKLEEETETMVEYMEKVSEEIEKMKVECAIANMELSSTIDVIDFESKVKDMEEMIKVFINDDDDDTIRDKEQMEEEKSTSS